MGTKTTQKDQLHLPPTTLASCVFSAIERDTTGRALTFHQRFNHFPASPLCAVSLFFEGEVFAVSHGRPSKHPLPRLTFSGPMSAPYSSWNSEAVRALSIGFFPEAWQALTGIATGDMMDEIVSLEEVVEGRLLTVFQEASESGSPKNAVKVIEEKLSPIWVQSRPEAPVFTRFLSDWVHSITARALMSNSGKSIRQAQRRVRYWTGQSQRGLHGFSRVDALHELSLNRATPLAELAIEGGFSDQSHMGREVQRVTGKSPAELRKLIETDEAFWAYRLLGERF